MQANPKRTDPNPFEFPPFVSQALHRSANQNLTIVSIGSDSRLYVPAWQNDNTGQWSDPGTNLLAFQPGAFQAISLCNGYQDWLQVLGLGVDRQVYLAAWQDIAGRWNAPAAGQSGPFGTAGREYQAVSTCRGNSGFLQVLALGTDGRIYLVAWQDEHGNFRPPHAINSGPFGAPGQTFSAFVTANGNSGYLQVLAIGTDGQIYLVAWQDSSGVWHQEGRRVGNPARHYYKLAAANGNSGYLQVLALGTDNRLYLAAWLDGDGIWHVSQRFGGPLGNETNRYRSVAACMGADGHLQVVCLGDDDGKAYLPAYQDGSGDWYATGPGYYGPLGNDPDATWQQIVLANGNHASGSKAGNLQAVGLGADPANYGLPWLVSWQGSNGKWHGYGPLDQTLSPLVNWQAPTGQVTDATCLAFGSVWVAQGSSILSFDAISGTPGLRISGFTNNASPRALQAWNDKLGVVCDDGNLYLVDPVSGGPRQLAPVGTPIWMGLIGERMFVAGYDNNSNSTAIVGVDPDGTVVGPTWQGLVAAAPAVGATCVYVPVYSSNAGIAKVSALDPSTLAEQWSIPTDGSPGPVYCNGTQLAFTSHNSSTGNNALYVYSPGGRCALTPNGAPIGLTQTPADIPPILVDGLCYVAFASTVEQIDWTTGGPGTLYGPIAQPTGAPVMSETGVLFYASDGPITVIDPAQENALWTWDTGGAPVIAAWADGTLYYAANDLACSVRLDELAHYFYAESCLIQDFDFSGGSSRQAAPNFQVVVALFDQGKVPRALQPVRITATEKCSLTWRGQPSTVTPEQGLDAVTDGNGRMRLTVMPGRFDSGGKFFAGLSAPALAVTSPFMDVRMRFVIRPNGQAMQQLATITAEQLVLAKNYAGNGVLRDEVVNDPTLLANATQAINETAGMIRTSMAAARMRPAGNSYCDPACDTAVACCRPVDALSGPLVGDRPFSFTFDLTPGASYFRRLAPEETAAIAATAAANGAAPEGSWGDAWDWLTSGAQSLSDASFSFLENGVYVTFGFVIDKVRQGFEGFIDDMWQATLILQGVVAKAFKVANEALEILSFVFNWPKIVALKNRIVAQLGTAWSTLMSGEPNVSLSGIKLQLDQQFDNLKNWFDNDINSVKKAIGNQTVNGAQANASGNDNGAVGTAQNNWLLDKYTTHIGLDRAVPAGSAAARLFDPPQEVNWPVLDVGDEIIAAIEGFLKQAETDVAGTATEMIENLRKDLFPTSGTSLLDRGISAILDAVKALVDIAIQLGKDAIDFLITLIQTLAQKILNFVNAKIDIPWFSDFYADWVSGSPLTLLDVFALVIAAPSAIALGIIDSLPSYQEGGLMRPVIDIDALDLPGGPKYGWWEAAMTVVAGCGQIVWGLVTGIMQTVNYGLLGGPNLYTPFRWLRVVLTLAAMVVVRGAFYAGAYSIYNKGFSPALYVWMVPTAVMLADILVSLVPGSTMDQMVLDVALDALIPLFGAPAMIGFGIWAFVESGDPQNAINILSLIVAVLVGVSFLGRTASFVADTNRLAGLVVLEACVASLIGSGGVEVARGTTMLIERAVDRRHPSALATS